MEDELGVILEEIQCALADLVVRGKIHEVDQKKVNEVLGPRRTTRSSKKIDPAGYGEQVSSLLFSSVKVIAGVPNLQYNHCPVTRVKCGAEKFEVVYKTNSHTNWSLSGFSMGAPREWFHHKSQKMSKYPEITNSTGSAHSENDIERLTYAVNSAAIADGSPQIRTC